MHRDRENHRDPCAGRPARTRARRTHCASILLLAQQEADPAYPVALEEIEYADHFLVAHFSVGGDHHGLLGVLRLSLLHARKQLGP